MSTTVRLLSLAESVRRALIDWIHTHNFDRLDPKDLRDLYIESDQIIADIQQQSAPAAEQITLTDRDWPEDFAHENGKYFCTCMFCDKPFVGHKRRVACKKCCAPSPAQEKPVEWMTEQEVAAVADLSERQGLSTVQVLRQALREYQMRVLGPIDLGPKAPPSDEKLVEASVGKIMTAACRAIYSELRGAILPHDYKWREWRTIEKHIDRAIRAALATASPSEDTKRIRDMREAIDLALKALAQGSPAALRDVGFEYSASAIENAIDILAPVALDAAMSSPSVTQTETKTSPSATTLSAQERQSQETGDLWTPWYLDTCNTSEVIVKDSRGNTVHYEDLGAIPSEWPSYRREEVVREAHQNAIAMVRWSEIHARNPSPSEPAGHAGSVVAKPKSSASATPEEKQLSENVRSNVPTKPGLYWYKLNGGNVWHHQEVVALQFDHPYGGKKGTLVVYNGEGPVPVARMHRHWRTGTTKPKR